MTGTAIRKILFVIVSLSGGGAERTLVRLLNSLDRKQFVSEVVLFHNVNDYQTEMPEDVVVNVIDKKSALDYPKMVWSLGQLIRKLRPSLVVSFMNYTNCLSLLARIVSGTRTPIIINEVNHFSSGLATLRYRRIKKRLVRSLYPQASRIITPSCGVRDDLCSHHGVPAHKCTVIHNPLDISRLREMATEETDHAWLQGGTPVLVACGRLTEQKNYPLLLSSFAAVNRMISCRLMILGNGPDKDDLVHLSQKLNIGDKVDFLGFQTNPYKFMARANIFVLSSKWEGFANVIIEAMACGVPVIATDCPSGPAEIIASNFNGILVPNNDVESLSQAILSLINDTGLRRRLADAGRRRAEDFAVERIVEEYENVFEMVSDFR